jgi:integrase/recombinase XerD
MKDLRVANARRESAFPTLAQCARAFECMPENTLRNRRDKAFFAMMMLTAARVSAALSLPLKHVDLVENCIQQDAREVATKFSKTFRTDFFPVDLVYRDYFCAWVRELREVHLFGHSDPLFPRITEHFAMAQAAGTKPPLKRQFQSTDTNIRKVVKDAFVSQGMPAFSPHSFRKTNALMMNDFCETLEEQKAWSQNLGHESIRTTVDDYMAVAPRRQRELFSKFSQRQSSGA